MWGIGCREGVCWGGSSGCKVSIPAVAAKYRYGRSVVQRVFVAVVARVAR